MNCAEHSNVATARRYEDLVCWRLSHELKDRVFEITATGPASQDRKFCEQIRESARSAPRNIAEGFGRFGPAEFRRFLQIARGSLTETHNHLRDGRDRGYFGQETHQQLSKLTGRAAIATGRLMKYLRDSKGPGRGRTS
jgi:four helix bundle protein